MSAGIGDAVDEDDEGMYVCMYVCMPTNTESLWASEKAWSLHCLPVPSQSNSIANTFHNRNITLLFEAVCENVRDDKEQWWRVSKSFHVQR